VTAEPEVSTSLIPKPVTGHDPEPAQSTFHSQLTYPRSIL